VKKVEKPTVVTPVAKPTNPPVSIPIKKEESAKPKEVKKEV
jgi:hypothetical protein